MKTGPIHNLLITGGGSGLGRAAALRLGRAGRRVFVADLDLAAARATLEAMGQPARDQALEVDVAREESVARLFRDLRARMEGLDMLVHTAGIMGSTDLADQLSFEDWKRVLAVNLDGAFCCAREALAWMQQAKGGRVVLFASIAGQIPTPGAAAYSAAKGGVISLGRTLAAEAARHNIRVNVIAPGYFQTPMLEGLPQGFEGSILKKTPLKRLGELEEMAGLVEFLASPEADFFTGQVLSPNGGLFM